MADTKKPEQKNIKTDILKPIPFLNEHLNQKITITLKNEMTIEAILIGFDIHMNLTLKQTQIIKETVIEEFNYTLLRGDNILYIQ